MYPSTKYDKTPKTNVVIEKDETQKTGKLQAILPGNVPASLRNLSLCIFFDCLCCFLLLVQNLFLQAYNRSIVFFLIWFTLLCNICVGATLLKITPKKAYKKTAIFFDSRHIHGKKMSKPNNVADASLYAMFSVVFGANHYWPSWRRLNREIMIRTSAGESDDDGGNHNRPSSTA